MKRIINIFAIVAFLSCEKIELKKADSNVPVVESYITPGKDVSVKIIKQIVFSTDDSTVSFIDDLEVRLSGGRDWIALDNKGKGIYEYPDLVVTEGAEYFLEFEYNNKLVTSRTSVPTKPVGFSTSASTIEAFTFSKGFTGGSFPEPPEPVTFTWSNPNSDYHMIIIENIEANPELINESTDMPRRIMRNAPVQGSSQEIYPMSFTYYGKHRIILFKLNPEYAALYEQMETTSLDITVPPSNIQNGLGIFTGINSDTVYVNVIEP